MTHAKIHQPGVAVSRKEANPCSTWRSADVQAHLNTTFLRDSAAWRAQRLYTSSSHASLIRRIDLQYAAHMGNECEYLHNTGHGRVNTGGEVIREA